MSSPYGINRIGNMIAAFGNEIRTEEGRWVRSVPLPYAGNIFERLRAAWWVFTGRAEAVIWPKPGEIEDALKEGK